MASLRRSLSPAYHHHHRLPLSASASSPRVKYVAHSHSGNTFHFHYHLWRRFLLFFLAGFLAGLFPFAHLHLDLDIDLRSSLHPPPPPPAAAADLRLPHQIDADSLVSVQLHQQHLQETEYHENNKNKLILVVTPTYNRAAQAYCLSRLGQTLRLVEPPLLWIVVEMGKEVTAETAEILRKSGVMYRHLVVCPKRNSTVVKDRGVHQRNAALDHIENHRLDGIVYFADDDNVYSLQLFDHIRQIRKFGTWPVAMMSEGKAKAILEGPVCNGSKVIGWHTNEKSKRLRRFHVDMSGFAFNSTLLWDPKRRHHIAWNTIRQLDTIKEGFQETTFIEQLVQDESEMEGIPSGCKRIMNWHLHLEANKNIPYPRSWNLPKNLHSVIPLK